MLNGGCRFVFNVGKIIWQFCDNLPSLDSALRCVDMLSSASASFCARDLASASLCAMDLASASSVVASLPYCPLS